MSRTADNLRRRIHIEIEYYHAQNENLRRELADLEDIYSNNTARLDVIRRDYDESEEMIRVMKLLTR